MRRLFANLLAVVCEFALSSVYEQRLILVDHLRYSVPQQVRRNDLAAVEAINTWQIFFRIGQRTQQDQLPTGRRGWS